MRISFVIYHLGSGGAERIMASLINYFDKFYEIDLIVYSEENFFYQLPEKVTVHHIISKKKPPFFSLLERIIKTYLNLKSRKPDLVISFLTETNIIAIICASILAIPVIISERTNPLKHKLNKRTLILRNYLYRFCSTLVVQTTDSANFFKKIIKHNKIITIPNFIDLSKFSKNHSSIPHKQILSIGRLSFEKGHDLLIKAFAISEAKRNGWRLIIVGDGPLFEKYKELIEQLDSKESIQLVGRKKNILEYLYSSTFFVLPSRYEGFPNVLLEAAAAGLPAIAFNCGMGIADVIEHDFNGLLADAENHESLRECIDLLSTNAQLLDKFKSNSKIKAQEFEFSKIIAQWQYLINKKLYNE